MADANPSGGLTTRPNENRGIVPVPRIHRALPPGERTVPTAVERLPQATPAAGSLPCLNPTCPGGATAHESATSASGAAQGRHPQRSGVCIWPAKGRPSYFCSGACREQYDYERTQLRADVLALQEALDAGGGTYRDRRSVETALAMRRWAWQRYLFDPSEVTSPTNTRTETSR